MDTVDHRLELLFEVIMTEARTNPAFAERLKRVLADDTMPFALAGRRSVDRHAIKSGRRSNRRAKAAVDLFALFSVSEQRLRTELAKLRLEQLKDVVSEYGMDSARLALKWKSVERLTELIVSTVVSRARKGDAFRPGASEGQSAAGTGPETDKPNTATRTPPPSILP